MQKLIYIALIPLFINSITAHKNACASGNQDTLSAEDSVPLSPKNLAVVVDDVGTPKTVDSEDPYSPDSYDLSLFTKWSKMGGRNVSGDVCDVVNFDEHSFFMTCAALLKPYMQNAQSTYSAAEKDVFQRTLTQIKEDSKMLIPTERYKIVQQLNVLAMFEGKLTFFQTVGRGRNAIRERITKTLADKFRLGTNRRYPMQLQCAQIASNTMTTEEATLTLCAEWEKEGIFDKRVKSCKKRLRSNGFHRYRLVNHEIIELLTYRSDHPRIVGGSQYGEKNIKRFCKRIKKKGHNKHQYIENVALLLTEKWKSEGVLNEAVEDCKIKLSNARLVGKAA